MPDTIVRPATAATSPQDADGYCQRCGRAAPRGLFDLVMWEVTNDGGHLICPGDEWGKEI